MPIRLGLVGRKKNHPLDGARRKLKRARRKIDNLETELRQWLAANPHVPLQEPHPEYDVLFVRAGLPRPPEDDWSLEVGEAMGQVRSALDHLVQQLVTANGKNPTGSHAFPIYTKEERFQRRKISGIDLRWKTEIESLQPYESPDSLEQNPLFRLNALTQFDKHWDINPVIIGSQALQVGSQVILHTSEKFAGGWIDMLLPPFIGHPVDGAVVAGAAFETFDEEARFDLNLSLACRVVFGKGMVGTDDMRSIIRVVDEILARFEPAFS